MLSSIISNKTAIISKMRWSFFYHTLMHYWILFHLVYIIVLYRHWGIFSIYWWLIFVLAQVSKTIIKIIGLILKIIITIDGLIYIVISKINNIFIRAIIHMFTFRFNKNRIIYQSFCFKLSNIKIQILVSYKFSIFNKIICFFLKFLILVFLNMYN